METDKVWATEVEVFALATLLDTPIASYTTGVGSNRRDPGWLFHRPIEQYQKGWENKASADDEINACIYLYNASYHFQRVISVKKGSLIT